MLHPKNYCSLCGESLSDITDGYKTCSNQSCRHKQYDNPIVGVATIYIKQNKILMGKRNGSHKKNQWCIPCGYLENENIEDGAMREFKEETGLTPNYIELFDAITNYDNPKQLTVGVYYIVSDCHGELQVNDDLDEIKFFTYAELAHIPLAFESDKKIIERLHAEEDLL